MVLLMFKIVLHLKRIKTFVEWEGQKVYTCLCYM